MTNQAAGEKPVIVRNYRGSFGAVRTRNMATDAAKLAAEGYVLVAQAWVPPVWSFGIFAIAVLLTVIGFLVPPLLVLAVAAWIWLMVDKSRSGSLVVTYRRDPDRRP